MAQVTTRGIYKCDGHDQEGHELAGGHPVIIVGKQSLIDNQGIAIVVPLTRTPPRYPVHWAVEIEAANSYAYVRHLKSVHITKIRDFLGSAKPQEVEDIRDGLTQHLNYDAHECATVLGQYVRPGSLWSASIPNARGLSYEGELLVLTSNRDTGMAIALAVEPEPRRRNPRQYTPVELQNPEQRGFAIAYQVRSVCTEDRFTEYRGEIPGQYLRFAMSTLIRCLEP